MAYPDENLVRLFRGQYAAVPRRGRVLDVGFGTGATPVMLAKTGFDAHGVEVAQSSIDHAQRLASAAGVELTLSLFEGIELPCKSQDLDVVLSWNAVYYAGDRTSVARAIAEYHRVLRPGGVLLLSVIHPKNAYVQRLSADLGDGRHRIERESPFDNRAGIEIFYEPTSSGWRRLLGAFSDVEEGYGQSDFFVPNRRVAWRFFIARSPA